MTDAIVFVITAFMVGGEVFMAAWGIFSWTCVVAWLAVMLYLTWDIWGARVVELQRDLVAELEEGTPPDFSSQRVLPPSRWDIVHFAGVDEQGQAKFDYPLLSAFAAWLRHHIVIGGGRWRYGDTFPPDGSR